MTTDAYKYGGAGAMVALHAKYLRAFLEVWRRADREGLALPATADRNYRSREALLSHVLGGGARYLIWICEKLELPVPDLDGRPDPEGLPARADEYLEEVLAAWEHPLRGLTAEMADSLVFESRWGVPYSIDAMLEHAVMHPIRHAYQLEQLMVRSAIRAP